MVLNFTSGSPTLMDEIQRHVSLSSGLKFSEEMCLCHNKSWQFKTESISVVCFLKDTESAFCVGVKTKCPTRNPICIQESHKQKILGTALTAVVFLELKNAFDTADHTPLLSNSNAYEIQEYA